jgi:hypothetical protein
MMKGIGGERGNNIQTIVKSRQNAQNNLEIW